MYRQTYGDKRLDVRGEGRPLHTCIIVHTSVHTIHTNFSFTMFTATTVRVVPATAGPLGERPPALAGHFYNVPTTLPS